MIKVKLVTSQSQSWMVLTIAVHLYQLFKSQDVEVVKSITQKKGGHNIISHS